jgi:serine/threonine-protein kinase RsbT
MLDAIERSLSFYVAESGAARRCRRELEALTMPASGPVSGPRPVTLRIRSEDDVLRARTEARAFAAARGFTTVGQTRLMTAVSELARNIALYAGEGQIDLTPISTPAGVEIVARDRGPGIPNLDRIMAGDYRSRLGMGLGLRGVKKLAERFEVRTEVGRGTTVSALLKTC